MKEQANFRLTLIARTLLAKIAKQLGVSATAALEVIIREAAKLRGIK